MNHREDFEWGRLFVPAVKRILGPLLLGEADEERDQNEATDLLVLLARDMRVGVRIRRSQYRSYAGQFTIRYSRPISGNRTEWAKILLDGWGDWLFYGFDAGGLTVDPWCIVDLARLRALYDAREPGLMNWDGWRGEKANHDGSSDFIWYDTRLIQWPRLLVAQSDSWPSLAARAA